MVCYFDVYSYSYENTNKKGGIELILNGKNVELENEITIDELLSIYKIDNSRVVVELNMEIISKDDYKKIKVKSKDTIEVISFVGGG